MNLKKIQFFFIRSPNKKINHIREYQSLNDNYCSIYRRMSAGSTFLKGIYINTYHIVKISSKEVPMGRRRGMG